MFISPKSNYFVRVLAARNSTPMSSVVALGSHLPKTKGNSSNVCRRLVVPT